MCTPFSNSIFSKLTDLGWGDEIERIAGQAIMHHRRNPLVSHRLVKQPKELSDLSKFYLHQLTRLYQVISDSFDTISMGQCQTRPREIVEDSKDP